MVARIESGYVLAACLVGEDVSPDLFADGSLRADSGTLTATRVLAVNHGDGGQATLGLDTRALTLSYST